MINQYAVKSFIWDIYKTRKNGGTYECDLKQFVDFTNFAKLHLDIFGKYADFIKNYLDSICVIHPMGYRMNLVRVVSKKH